VPGFDLFSPSPEVLSMRKLLLACGCLIAMSSLALAAEVVLVKFDKDKKEMTVKDGDKETTYKITDKTKITFAAKDGTAKEGSYDVVVKIMSSPSAPGKAKFEISTDKDTITELKFKARGK
jgi:hypothetical protein